MLFSKQTPAAGGEAFAQFDAAWAYDGNGYILNDTGTSLDVRIGASGSVQTLAAGGTLPIKLVYSLAELYVRRTDQSTTQVTVEAQVGTGSAGGGTTPVQAGAIAAQAAAAAVAGHDASNNAHALSLVRSLATASFRDDFRFAETVGATRSIAGGGRMRQITDTAAVATLPGGALVLAGTGQAWNDPAYIFDNGAGAFPHNPRSAYIFDVVGNQINGYVYLNLSPSTTFAQRYRVGVGIGSGFFDDCADDDVAGRTSNHILSTPAREQTAYRIAIVESDTRGVFFYALGGDFTRWTLLGVNYGTKHKKFAAFPVVAAEGLVESAVMGVSVVGLGGLGKPENAAIIDTRMPTNGGVVQSAADAVHIINPWGITNGVTQTAGAKYEIQYRRQDASNYLFARLKVSGAQKVFMEAGRVVAGVETLYGDVSGTSLGGLTMFVGLQIRAYGNKVFITSLNKQTAVAPLAEQTETNFQSATAISCVWTGESTPRFQSFPLVSDAYDAAFGIVPVKWYCGLGDSKTANSNKWQWYLAQLAWQRDKSLISFGVEGLGVGGSTLGNHWNAIVNGTTEGGVTANELDLMPFVPEAVLFNLGTNDFGSWGTGGFPEQWEARLGAVLDAIHAKWASAIVYVAIPAAKSASAGAVAGVAAAIGRQVAARALYCRIGHDERSWLEGGDDFATMTSDGTHYSVAGARELATIWHGLLA